MYQYCKGNVVFIYFIIFFNILAFWSQELDYLSSVKKNLGPMMSSSAQKEVLQPIHTLTPTDVFILGWQTTGFSFKEFFPPKSLI